MIKRLDQLKAPATTDGRQIRSRSAMHQTLLQLLEQKTLEQISIRELAAAAGIGHATFYRHYSSKEALLNDLAADEIRHMVQLTLPLLSESDSSAAWLEMCSYVDQHRQLWTTLLTGGAASAVKEELLQISREIAEQLYGDQPRANSDEMELTLILSVTTILETLSWWLRQARPFKPQKVAGILQSRVEFRSAP
ncbi:TetR/AcrR family transcriptional regulator [Pseudomaricurvus sp. HS19]|uniref:TetR/AcrR family transcriptional regulator n=1 Tax=Pseudomaricurvus sp. HS19 TaxID=2692626 RepID=UPI00136F163B|nr:TetR/AcrR family transcriptional regulator [Pseudomaricurvus sp. HS19]MYM61964.1 TetR family transcriptional regulator [Pseudomaricurvus sp. HS19]